MKKKLVLTVVGPDQPGLVDRLSGHLAEQSWNIEDSRMAVLGGEFAGILLVSGLLPEEHNLETYAAQIEAVSGMHVSARETTEAPHGRPGIPFLVQGYAIDHPGIVHGLAHEIASLGANIETLETTATPAPLTGTPLFEVRMRVALPPDVSIPLLKKKLADLGDRLNIDIAIEAC
jgi:glycine cleavage system transcriptional repressor